MSVTVEMSTTDSGKTAYSFSSRGTSYFVVEDGGGLFEVWSRRLALCGNGWSINMLSLDELKQRSKALRHLASLIGGK